MTYNASDDWIAPKPISINDELTTVETAYGDMEKWKARALAIGWFQRVADQVRNDSVGGVGASELGYETKPPPLAADAEPTDPDPEWMGAINSAVDALTVRVGKLERRRAAEAALDALETEIEQMYPSKDDDDDDVFARDLKPKH